MSEEFIDAVREDADQRMTKAVARTRSEFAGVRSARKHIGWTLKGLPGGEAFRAEMNAIESCDAQARAVAAWFDCLADTMPRMPLADESSGNVALPLH